MIWGAIGVEVTKLNGKKKFETRYYGRGDIEFKSIDIRGKKSIVRVRFPIDSKVGIWLFERYVKRNPIKARNEALKLFIKKGDKFDKEIEKF